ncbi:tetratricopeptide repeat protein [Celeribacter litoreus]|uniref:tetratricopeptide repeat protein n=1 Tax=Celeribacter litoreus TaxID=2876714 RepID=UPI001CC9206C|nr:hypothetical protein [Celeribacter litoreus]MCA0044633.1 hypothetical protein [Celeribacter litoreus]
MRTGFLWTVGFALWSGAAAAQSDYDTCVALNANTQPEATIAACSTALEAPLLDFERAEALASRGVAWRQLGENGKSLRDLRRAKGLDATPNTQRMLAWTWHELGYDKTAEWLYTRVLKEDPNMQGYLSRCVVRLDLGKIEEASTDCAEAMELDSESEDVIYFYARSLNLTGLFEDALGVSNWGLELFGETSARLHVENALALYGMGRVDEAIAKAAAAHEAFPDDESLIQFLALTEGF